MYIPMADLSICPFRSGIRRKHGIRLFKCGKLVSFCLQNVHRVLHNTTQSEKYKKRPCSSWFHNTFKALPQLNLKVKVHFYYDHSLWRSPVCKDLCGYQIKNNVLFSFCLHESRFPLITCNNCLPRLWMTPAPTYIALFISSATYSQLHKLKNSEI